MGRALLFVITAIATALVVYLIAAPRYLDKPQAPADRATTAIAPSTQQPTSNDLSTPVVTPPQNTAPNAGNDNIAPPVTSEQKSKDDIEKQRGPLYDLIRSDFGSILLGWQPLATDRATLDLYLAQATPANIELLVRKLVQPHATKYGFNHVRFLEPNTGEGGDHWRVDSEADPDAEGIWHVVRK